MAHRKLVSTLNRSLLAASTAALVAGPLAGAAAAQVDTVTDALGNEVECLLTKANPEPETPEEKEACELEAAQKEAEATATKTTTSTKKTAETTTTTTRKAVERSTGGGGSPPKPPANGPAPTAPTAPTAPAPSKPDAPTGGNNTPNTPASPPTAGSPRGGNKVQASGNNVRPLDPRQHAANTAGIPGDSGMVAFNNDGPVLPGMRSFSDLTLQPFQAPVVSVPPVYDLPQLATNYLTGGEVEAPMVATTTDELVTSATQTPITPASSSSTPAELSAWMLATAAGLVLLVGTGHALRAGTPATDKVTTGE